MGLRHPKVPLAIRLSRRLPLRGRRLPLRRLPLPRTGRCPLQRRASGDSPRAAVSRRARRSVAARCRAVRYGPTLYYGMACSVRVGLLQPRGTPPVPVVAAGRRGFRSSSAPRVGSPTAQRTCSRPESLVWRAGARPERPLLTALLSVCGVCSIVFFSFVLFYNVTTP